MIHVDRRSSAFALLLAGLLIAAPSGAAHAQNIEVFAPTSASGPGVLLISGVSGTALYRDFGRAVAQLGYTAVLVSGKDVSNEPGESSENLRKILASIRWDSRVKPGKIAVVGFSLGGGGALLHASSQSENFSAVVAYYPAVTRLPNISDTAKRVTVPTLILAGEKDKFNNCCLIESIREFEAAAKAGGLVTIITYPEAGHAFNLAVPAFRSNDASDAWSRVKEFLLKYLPK
jgi:dienelactone hydrolase